MTVTAEYTDLYYYLKNSHGDVIGFTDTYGTLTETYRYDAFGTLTSIRSLNENGVLAEAETALSRFLYAGEQLDATTGLYYLRARQYDTMLGRFTQEDTYLGDGRNLYVYVRNNPLKYVDPSGHCGKGLGYDAAERLNNLYRDMAGGAEVEAYIDVDSPMMEENIGSGIWEEISELKNNDGTYSLYDNQRNKRKKTFHEQLFVFELSKPSLSFEEGLSVGLGSVSGTVITGGWEGEYVDASLLDFLSAGVSAELWAENGLDLEAIASIWSPSVEFSFFDLTIEIEGYVGGIGGKLQISPTGGFSFGGASGVGASISVKWEEE